MRRVVPYIRTFTLALCLALSLGAPSHAKDEDHDKLSPRLKAALPLPTLIKNCEESDAWSDKSDPFRKIPEEPPKGKDKDTLKYYQADALQVNHDIALQGLRLVDSLGDKATCAKFVERFGAFFNARPEKERLEAFRHDYKDGFEKMSLKEHCSGLTVPPTLRAATKTLLLRRFDADFWQVERTPQAYKLFSPSVWMLHDIAFDNPRETDFKAFYTSMKTALMDSGVMDEKVAQEHLVDQAKFKALFEKDAGEKRKKVVEWALTFGKRRTRTFEGSDINRWLSLLVPILENEIKGPEDLLTKSNACSIDPFIAQGRFFERARKDLVTPKVKGPSFLDPASYTGRSPFMRITSKSDEKDILPALKENFRIAEEALRYLEPHNKITKDELLRLFGKFGDNTEEFYQRKLKASGGDADAALYATRLMLHQSVLFEMERDVDLAARKLGVEKIPPQILALGHVAGGQAPFKKRLLLAMEATGGVDVTGYKDMLLLAQLKTGFSEERKIHLWNQNLSASDKKKILDWALKNADHANPEIAEMALLTYGLIDNRLWEEKKADDSQRKHLYWLYENKDEYWYYPSALMFEHSRSGPLDGRDGMRPDVLRAEIAEKTGRAKGGLLEEPPESGGSDTEFGRKPLLELLDRNKKKVVALLALLENPKLTREAMLKELGAFYKYKHPTADLEKLFPKDKRGEAATAEERALFADAVLSEYLRIFKTLTDRAGKFALDLYYISPDAVLLADRAGKDPKYKYFRALFFRVVSASQNFVKDSKEWGGALSDEWDELKPEDIAVFKKWLVDNFDHVNKNSPTYPNERLQEILGLFDVVLRDLDRKPGDLLLNGDGKGPLASYDGPTAAAALKAKHVGTAVAYDQRDWTKPETWCDPSSPLPAIPTGQAQNLPIQKAADARLRLAKQALAGLSDPKLTRAELLRLYGPYYEKTHGKKLSDLFPGGKAEGQPTPDELSAVARLLLKDLSTGHELAQKRFRDLATKKEDEPLLRDALDPDLTFFRTLCRTKERCDFISDFVSLKPGEASNKDQWGEDTYVLKPSLDLRKPPLTVAQINALLAIDDAHFALLLSVRQRMQFYDPAALDALILNPTNESLEDASRLWVHFSPYPSSVPNAAERNRKLFLKAAELVERKNFMTIESLGVFDDYYLARMGGYGKGGRTLSRELQDMGVTGTAKARQKQAMAQGRNGPNLFARDLLGLPWNAGTVTGRQVAHAPFWVRGEDKARLGRFLMEDAIGVKAKTDTPLSEATVARLNRKVLAPANLVKTLVPKLPPEQLIKLEDLEGLVDAGALSEREFEAMFYAPEFSKAIDDAYKKHDGKLISSDLAARETSDRLKLLAMSPTVRSGINPDELRRLFNFRLQELSRNHYMLSSPAMNESDLDAAMPSLLMRQIYDREAEILLGHLQGARFDIATRQPGVGGAFGEPWSGPAPWSVLEDPEHDWSTEDAKAFEKWLADPSTVSPSEVIRIKKLLERAVERAKEGGRKDGTTEFANPLKKISDELGPFVKKVWPGFQKCSAARHKSHPDAGANDVVNHCRLVFRERDAAFRKTNDELRSIFRDAMKEKKIPMGAVELPIDWLKSQKGAAKDFLDKHVFALDDDELLEWSLHLYDQVAQIESMLDAARGKGADAERNAQMLVDAATMLPAMRLLETEISRRVQEKKFKYQLPPFDQNGGKIFKWSAVFSDTAGSKGESARSGLYDRALQQLLPDELLPSGQSFESPAAWYDWAKKKLVAEENFRASIYRTRMHSMNFAQAFLLERLVKSREQLIDSPDPTGEGPLVKRQIEREALRSAEAKKRAKDTLPKLEALLKIATDEETKRREAILKLPVFKEPPDGKLPPGVTMAGWVADMPLEQVLNLRHYLESDKGHPLHGGPDIRTVDEALIYPPHLLKQRDYLRNQLGPLADEIAKMEDGWKKDSKKKHRADLANRLRMIEGMSARELAAEWQRTLERGGDPGAGPSYIARSALQMLRKAAKSNPPLSILVNGESDDKHITFQEYLAALVTDDYMGKDELLLLDFDIDKEKLNRRRLEDMRKTLMIYLDKLIEGRDIEMNLSTGWVNIRADDPRRVILRLGITNAVRAIDRAFVVGGKNSELLPKTFTADLQDYYRLLLEERANSSKIFAALKDLNYDLWGGDNMYHDHDMGIPAEVRVRLANLSPFLRGHLVTAVDRLVDLRESARGKIKTHTGEEFDELIDDGGKKKLSKRVKQYVTELLYTASPTQLAAVKFKAYETPDKGDLDKFFLGKGIDWKKSGLPPPPHPLKDHKTWTAEQRQEIKDWILDGLTKLVRDPDARKKVEAKLKSTVEAVSNAQRDYARLALLYEAVPEPKSARDALKLQIEAIQAQIDKHYEDLRTIRGELEKAVEFTDTKTAEALTYVLNLVDSAGHTDLSKEARAIYDGIGGNKRFDPRYAIGMLTAEAEARKKAKDEATKDPLAKRRAEVVAQAQAYLTKYHGGMQLPSLSATSILNMNLFELNLLSHLMEVVPRLKTKVDGEVLGLKVDVAEKQLLNALLLPNKDTLVSLAMLYDREYLKAARYGDTLDRTREAVIRAYMSGEWTPEHDRMLNDLIQIEAMGDTAAAVESHVLRVQPKDVGRAIADQTRKYLEDSVKLKKQIIPEALRREAAKRLALEFQKKKGSMSDWMLAEKTLFDLRPNPDLLTADELKALLAKDPGAKERIQVRADLRGLLMPEWGALIPILAGAQVGYFRQVGDPAFLKKFPTLDAYVEHTFRGMMNSTEVSEKVREMLKGVFEEYGKIMAGPNARENLIQLLTQTRYLKDPKDADKASLFGLFLARHLDETFKARLLGAWKEMFVEANLKGGTRDFTRAFEGDIGRAASRHPLVAPLMTAGPLPSGEEITLDSADYKTRVEIARKRIVEMQRKMQFFREWEAAYEKDRRHNEMLLQRATSALAMQKEIERRRALPSKDKDKIKENPWQDQLDEEAKQKAGWEATIEAAKKALKEGEDNVKKLREDMAKLNEHLLEAQTTTVAALWQDDTREVKDRRAQLEETYRQWAKVYVAHNNLCTQTDEDGNVVKKGTIPANLLGTRRLAELRANKKDVMKEYPGLQTEGYSLLMSMPCAEAEQFVVIALREHQGFIERGRQIAKGIQILNFEGKDPEAIAKSLMAMPMNASLIDNWVAAITADQRLFKISKDDATAMIKAWIVEAVKKQQETDKKRNDAIALMEKAKLGLKWTGTAVSIDDIDFSSFGEIPPPLAHGAKPTPAQERWIALEQAANSLSPYSMKPVDFRADIQARLKMLHETNGFSPAFQFNEHTAVEVVRGSDGKPLRVENGTMGGDFVYKFVPLDAKKAEVARLIGEIRKRLAEAEFLKAEMINSVRGLAGLAANPWQFKAAASRYEENILKMIDMAHELEELGNIGFQDKLDTNFRPAFLERTAANQAALILMEPIMGSAYDFLVTIARVRDDARAAFYEDLAWLAAEVVTLGAAKFVHAGAWALRAAVKVLQGVRTAARLHKASSFLSWTVQKITILVKSKTNSKETKELEALLAAGGAGKKRNQTDPVIDRNGDGIVDADQFVGNPALGWWSFGVPSPAVDAKESLYGMLKSMAIFGVAAPIGEGMALLGVPEWGAHALGFGLSSFGNELAFGLAREGEWHFGEAFEHGVRGTLYGIHWGGFWKTLIANTLIDQGFLLKDRLTRKVPDGAYVPPWWEEAAGHLASGTPINLKFAWDAGNRVKSEPAKRALREQLALREKFRAEREKERLAQKEKDKDKPTTPDADKDKDKEPEKVELPEGAKSLVDVLKENAEYAGMALQSLHASEILGLFKNATPAERAALARYLRLPPEKVIPLLEAHNVTWGPLNWGRQSFQEAYAPMRADLVRQTRDALKANTLSTKDLLHIVDHTLDPSGHAPSILKEIGYEQAYEKLDLGKDGTPDQALLRHLALDWKIDTSSSGARMGRFVRFVEKNRAERALAKQEPLKFHELVALFNKTDKDVPLPPVPGAKGKLIPGLHKEQATKQDLKDKDVLATLEAIAKSDSVGMDDLEFEGYMRFLTLLKETRPDLHLNVYETMKFFKKDIGEARQKFLDREISFESIKDKPWIWAHLKARDLDVNGAEPTKEHLKAAEWAGYHHGIGYESFREAVKREPQTSTRTLAEIAKEVRDKQAALVKDIDKAKPDELQKNEPWVYEGLAIGNAPKEVLESANGRKLLSQTIEPLMKGIDKPEKYVPGFLAYLEKERARLGVHANSVSLHQLARAYLKTISSSN